MKEFIILFIIYFCCYAVYDLIYYLITKRQIPQFKVFSCGWMTRACTCYLVGSIVYLFIAKYIIV